MLARINFHEFQKIMDDTYNGTSFDYDGLQILFDFIEGVYEDLEQDYILDRVGLCCEFTQMTFDEVCDYYSIDILDDDKKQSALDYIEYHSILIGHTDNSVIFHSF